MIMRRVTESEIHPSELGGLASPAPAGASGSGAGQWLAAMLQMNDTFYPTGTYAHSFGLEGLITQGVVRDRDTLRMYLHAAVLPMLRQADLPLVWHAYTALGNSDWEAVSKLSILGSALKSAKEARVAAENIGRQRLELCARHRKHPLAEEFLRRAEADNLPFSSAIAAALEARVIGAPVEAAFASVFYGTIAAVLAAAMKLLRLGQNAVQSLLTEILLQADELFARAQNVTTDEIGWYNPWLDIAAARHETADARLFIS